MSKKLPWKTLSSDQNTVTLSKFCGDFAVAGTTPNSTDEDLLRQALVIDLETTGTDVKEDKIIELALRTFTFNRETGEIVSINDSYADFEDPQQPLSEQIVQLTGITDKDVAGKKIDWAKVTEILNGSHLIIAHNARFDRGFLDRYMKESRKKVWGCSNFQIDWLKRGFTKQNLEMLCAYHGFFVEAHRALSDVDSLIHLLTMKDGETADTYFKELMTNAKRPRVKVSATNSRFETKDILRANRYRWNNQERVWWKEVYKDQQEEEISWLDKNVYGGDFQGKIDPVPLHKHFT